MKKLITSVLVLTMALCFVACSNDSSNNDDEKNEELSFNAGTYEGSAQGYGGEIKATVEVSENKIEKVTIVGEGETQGIGSNAIDKMPDEIVKAQSTKVDGVAGATKSSEAIIKAVNEALDKAKK